MRAILNAGMRRFFGRTALGTARETTAQGIPRACSKAAQRGATSSMMTLLVLVPGS
jgi:hypothetical protein